MSGLKILQGIVKVLARLTIWRYRPFVIGITGSVGKTSTKLATSIVLANSTSVRAARGNLNNELGFPLSILGDYDGLNTGKVSFWIGVILKSILKIIFKTNYPKVLILEYAADRPGDLDYLLSIVKPDIAVVTAIGKVPVHVEFYSSPEDVAKEKSKLVKGVKHGGTVILNFDDPTVIAMRTLTRERVITYGFSEGADVRIIAFENIIASGKPVGMDFKVLYNGSFVPIRIDGTLGRAQTYAIGAASAVALERWMNLVYISDLLSKYHGEHGRTQIIDGINDTSIIDDTYNSSPTATESALEILSSLSAPRKVAILGDMGELGDYSEKSHRDIGDIVAKAANVLITVGPKSLATADAAIKSGLSKDMVFNFDDSKIAASKVKGIISPKDIILVKGSQSMRMERVVKELMANPEKAPELLVRQYGKWLKD